MAITLSDPYLILIAVFLGLIALSLLTVAIVALSVGRRLLKLLAMRGTVLGTFIGLGTSGSMSS